MSAPSPSASLNPEQQAAVDQTRGPVVIVAGAGTGKTTTVTHRIANQVHTGAFLPHEILAVTFTRKAADELRARLAALGADGVETRTFHSFALAVVRGMWREYTGTSVGELMSRKEQLLGPIIKRLPGGYKYRSASDVRSAIDWARNLRIPTAGLAQSLEQAGQELPLPAEMLDRVVAEFEQGKASQGLIDFEDMIEMAITLLEQHPAARERIHARVKAVTVDEYQDVNPLQQALLDHVVGGRDDLCVVGDDHQTIYTFTGASSHHLLSFAERYPTAHVVTLSRNYRSTPQVIETANKVAEHIRGHKKELISQQSAGAETTVTVYPSASDEVAAIVRQCIALADEGLAYTDMAVLFRANTQSVEYEAEFGRRGIPIRVQGRAFLDRRAAQQLRRHFLSRDQSQPAVEAIEAAAREFGYDPDANTRVGSAEHIRQADFSRLVEISLEHASRAGTGATVEQYFSHLTQQFAGSSDDGVNLLTLHMAKGLEWDAVFLPNLVQGTLPYWKGKQKAPIDDERRLFFVGITRARKHLHLSCGLQGKAKPSMFLTEAGLLAADDVPAPAAVKSKAPAATVDELTDEQAELFEQLREWRKKRAGKSPAYTVLDNKTLAAICKERPTSESALLACPGIGPSKLEKYGADVLAVVGGA